MRLRSVVALPLLSLACGGGSPSPASPDSANGSKKDSIGALAASQGGLSSVGSFGGGGNATHGYSTAAPSSLRLEEVDAQNPINLDGVVGEWPARYRAEGGGGASLSAAMLYDTSKIYVGVELSKLPKNAVTLVLAFPGNGGTFTTYEVALKPGKPGESSGDVRFASGTKRGSEITGASIIEAPNGDGLSFEAVIPWTAFSEARTTRVGLRGGLKWSEGSANAATGPLDAASPSKMPSLPTEPELSLIEGLLGPKNLPDRPTYELYADITGDPQKERVALYGKVLTIVGHGYRSGREFFFRDLGTEVLSLELRDVTGDNRADLILRRRSGDVVSREWVDILALDKSEEPRSVFTHEVVVAKGQDKVLNSLRIAPKSIELVAESSSTWDPNAYKEAPSRDSDPILLPWGAVKSQTFEFDGTSFTKTNEVAQKPTGPAAAAVAVKTPESVAPLSPKEIATPKETTTKSGDNGTLIFERFKKERSLESAPVRKDVQVHVAEDPRPERVVLIGKDLVVFGPGFLGGASYAYISLDQFGDGSSVELTTRDLTGDGAAELIVRGNATLSKTPELTEANLMIAYSVGAQGIKRIFTIETARTQKGKRAQGLVQFIPAPSGKTFDIDVRPGKVEGWTEKTYPWDQAAPGSGPYEPLLLPWGNPNKLRYTWNGSAFALVK